MFNIISKDCLRAQVEAVSDNKVTVLYDDKGYPSLMAVIPKMKLSDCFPGGISTVMDSAISADDVHPAFKVYDSSGESCEEVSEIFISQYRNSIVTQAGSDYADYSNCRAISLPGQLDCKTNYKNTGLTTEYPIRTIIENKGPNWHLMNIWEYSLLQFWAYKNNIQIDGPDNAPARVGTAGSWQLNLDTEASGDWTSGETIVGQDSGASGHLVSWDTWGSTDHLGINDVYGPFFTVGETVVGQTSGRSCAIASIGSHYLGGTGPLTWSHNHKYSGVWDLNVGYYEVLDGVRVRKMTTSGIDCFMLMLSPGNYYQWNDDLLKTLHVKFSPANLGVNLTLKLGYQNINSGGAPVVPLEADPNVTEGLWGVWGYTLGKSANYALSVPDADKLALITTGFDMYDFPDSDQVTRAAGAWVRFGSPLDSIYAKAPNVGVYCTVFSHDFFAEDLTNSQLSFRSVYIP